MRRADLGREVARPEACRAGQGNREAGRAQASRFPCPVLQAQASDSSELLDPTGRGRIGDH